MIEFYLKLAAALSAFVVAIVYVAFAPSTVSVQRGYEGVGMDHVYNRAVLGKTAMDNEVPPSLPAPDMSGDRAANIYQNVQVLGNLSAGQFNRLMASMTLWVAPEQGCNYCHNPENMASDEVYTKHVARRMLQMTQHINENWQKHVGKTGVTCYTCHRGQPVPQYIWFNEPRNEYAYRMLGNPAQQNIAAPNVTQTSLPKDPFTPFLEKDSNIRVIGSTPLPTGNRSSIKQAEWTYALMIHMSDGLGVNCTYCHNSRSFAEWAQSPPARSTAWYGIRMVRNINDEYTKPLKKYYPDYRLGQMGDPPKANCKTCHQGAYKPLLGVSMAKDFKSLQASTMYVPPPPPADTDGDGMTDDVDQCVDEPETVNNFRDADGCADEIPAALEGFVGSVRGVRFGRNTGRMSRATVRTLNRAIRVLRNVEDLKLNVRVHAEASNDAETADTLSGQRAAAVRDYLITHGLAGEQVTAEGVPASETTPGGTVEFVVN